MYIQFRNYTTCIRSDKRELIEPALIRILKQEGCHRISNLPMPMSDEKLIHTPFMLLCDIWMVGLFVGAPGWTIVKTEPKELLCSRAKGADRSRLSQLSMQIGCDTFYLGAYHHYGILLEADATGRTFISGEVDCPEEENRFYEEHINKYGDLEFSLLDMPQEIKSAVKLPDSEEKEEKERRFKELDVLREQAREEAFDIQGEYMKLMESNSEGRDQALASLLGGSRSYWKIRMNNLFYLAYTQRKQLESDGARLLYFRPAEHYRQLDPLEASRFCNEY